MTPAMKTKGLHGLTLIKIDRSSDVCLRESTFLTAATANVMAPCHPWLLPSTPPSQRKASHSDRFQG